MAKIVSSVFRPDWVSPPGESALHLMTRRSISLTELACLLGFTKTDATDFLSGNCLIDDLLAKKLEAALGCSVAFWLAREKNFRDSLTSEAHKLRSCGL